MNNTPENDPAWDLLKNASKQEARETFSRDVMRSIRLDTQTSTPWWKRALTPAPVLGTLATAAACVALVVSSQTPKQEAANTLTHSSTSSSVEESFAELAASYDSSDDFDDLINPIPLVATNNSATLSDLAFFMDL